MASRKDYIVIAAKIASYINANPSFSCQTVDIILHVTRTILAVFGNFNERKFNDYILGLINYQERKNESN